MTRAAASSMASGSPSSRAADLGHRRRVLVGHGEVRLGGRARSTNRRTASYCDSASSAGRSAGSGQRRAAARGYSCSPQTCSGDPAGDQQPQVRGRPRAGRRSGRRARRPARSCRARAGSGATPRQSASALSDRPARPRARRATARWPGPPARGRRPAPGGTKKTPSGKSSSDSAATCSASRVLPVPPGPVSVSSRVVGQQRGEPRRPPARGRRSWSAGCGRLLGVASSVRSGGKSVGQAGDGQLEDALRAREVLEPVLAEVAQRDPGREAGRGQDSASFRRPGPGRHGPRSRCGPPGGRRGRRSRRPAPRRPRRCGCPSGRAPRPRRGHGSAASARWALTAASTADGALRKTTKNESPSVLNS